ncbi:MAG: HAD family hydrolase [Oscillospiraceae bacterium]|nr:HAD family hydrolase [Oscillospiraceae bacterium]
MIKYKAIVFDVGDTLLEHYPSQSQIYAERMKSAGFAVDAQISRNIAAAIEKASHEQIAKEQNGAPRMSDADFEVMLDLAALRCVAKEKEQDEKTIEKLKHISLPEQELRIIPGTLEVLDALKAKGYRLSIVSNHRVWLLDYLSQIGLADYFETIVISDIVGFEKPDVRIMQIALEKLSLEASECLYVGDHPFDVFCAKKAGMDCAWLASVESVLPESVPYKEDFRIKNLNELLFFV